MFGPLIEDPALLILAGMTCVFILEAYAIDWLLSGGLTAIERLIESWLEDRFDDL